MTKEQYVARCEACEIHAESRMSKISAAELCKMHNESRDGCEAEPVPVCWVCGDFATHRDTQPPYEFACDEHAVGIDMVPVEEADA